MESQARQSISKFLNGPLLTTVKWQKHIKDIVA